ncbi:MAG: hypothetical protein KAT32_03180 [Candidatus Moranbacteria bacterium]|nr:hypothetical protein [Candidatus Moranbacteria bacterium]
MKKLATMFILSSVIILSGCGNESESDQLTNLLSEESVIVTPSRPADLNGIISITEGNKIIVKNEVGKEILSEEEQAQKKDERQNMTQEERQALRAEEKEEIETVDVTIEIPVGTLIIKGSGDGSGDVIKTSFEELKKGIYISIWKNGDSIEAIKIKGI